MIYLLVSHTGEYEDYTERIHGYFTNKELAYNKLNQIQEFDKLIFSKFKGNDKYYYDVYRFQSRCYRRFGIPAYIDYTGISWSIQEIKEYKDKI